MSRYRTIPECFQLPLRCDQHHNRTLYIAFWQMKLATKGHIGQEIIDGSSLEQMKMPYRTAAVVPADGA